MKNVLHLIDSTGPGGAETIFLELATGLDPSAWRSYAAVVGPGWVHDQLTARGVRPLVLGASGRAFDAGLVWQLVKAIRRYRIDLVQTHLLGSAVYGTVAARLAGARVVCTLHGAWDLEGPGRLMGLKRWLVGRADRVVCVSRSLRDTLDAAGFVASPDRVAVIHNGITPPPRIATREATRRRLGVHNGQLLVGAIGNVRPAKGYDVLLEAAALVTARLPAVRFMVAGDTAHPEYEGLCRRRAGLGLEETAEFLGFRDDVWDLLGAFDVLVSTSRSEGFSLSTVQGMAAGVPVVATRSGGPEEILDDRRTGLLVPEGSAAAVAEAITRVLASASLRQQLSGDARREAEQRFSLGRMLRRYEDVYLEVLGGRVGVQRRDSTHDQF